MRKQLLISASILLFLAIGTIAVVAYGRGYRFGVGGGKIQLSGTGMLVATSLPDGAQVFINDHLTTATDDTLNLFPGDYIIKIVKDGYFPWEKKIKLQKEVVAKAEARLFPTAPKLSNITTSGVGDPVIDPSMTKLAYTVASQSARKNGIYVLDMTSRPILTLQSASTQIVDETVDTFSNAQLSWSPDGTELIATLSATTTPTTYLLSANGYNSTPQDVTATLSSVQASWDKEKQIKDQARLATFKPLLQQIITNHFKVLAWSLDDTRILYQASDSAKVDVVIKPRLVGIDATPEQRDIQKDKVYVYDIKEDKNYELPVTNVTASGAKQSQTEIAASPLPSGQSPRNDGAPTLSWLPDSKHLLYVHDKKIDIMEFDGSNVTTIFAGPFTDNYVFPWPNGSKVLILTNLGNTSILPNLYTIDLE